MGLRDQLQAAWWGTSPRQLDLHDNSNLAEIILATELQAGSPYAWRQTIAAVYRGTQLLADLAASLPWYTYEGGAWSGSNRNIMPERQDTRPTVLLRPDPAYTRDDWIRQVTLSLIWWGNAYLHKMGRDRDGHPTLVRVLHPPDVSVTWADQARTRRVYKVRDQVVPAADIDHLALNRRPTDLTGTGPLDAGIQQLEGQIAADKFARDLFIQDGVPSGKLMHPGKLSQPEAEQLLEAWQAGQSGGRKTAVLSGGIDYQPVSLTPDQAQMLQSRAFGVSEIARWLGIPAHLLNASTGVAGSSGASLTYTNVRDTWVELVKLTLHPVYLQRLEEVASGWLPRGQSVRFDTHDLERADTSTRYASHQVALTAGFLTVDEVRALEGLAPSPELAADREANRRMAEQISGDAPEDDEEEADAPAEPAG